MSDQPITTLAQSAADIQFQPALCHFSTYEVTKQAATSIAEFICSTPLTEDNIAEARRTLAEARKLTTALNKRRIDIQKAILVNFDKTKSQIDEIIGIIESADDDLRRRVRQLDDIEREEKRKAINELWEKRIAQYPMFSASGDIGLWLEPKHLNKTMTMAAVEKDMTAWLTQKEKELKTMHDLGDGYFETYITCGMDSCKTLEQVAARKDAAKRHAEAAREAEAPEPKRVHFIITGYANITLTRMLLKQNDIDFTEEN